jgi:hypothetical protein
MLKATAPYISSFLNYICNKSIRSGTLPCRLKYSIVKPLFKKGDRENMANYRKWPRPNKGLYNNNNNNNNNTGMR